MKVELSVDAPTKEQYKKTKMEAVELEVDIPFQPFEGMSLLLAGKGTEDDPWIKGNVEKVEGRPLGSVLSDEPYLHVEVKLNEPAQYVQLCRSPHWCTSDWAKRENINKLPVAVRRVA